MITDYSQSFFVFNKYDFVLLNHTYTAENIIRTISCILILHIFANYILQFDALSCKKQKWRERNKWKMLDFTNV